MVLSLPEMISKYGLAPTGVIHVGAHFGQEYDRYKEAGLKDIIFIEPCTPAFRQLQKNMEGKSDVTLFKLACSEEKGTAMMNVEAKNEGMSNSLRKPKKHLEQYPDIMFDYNEQVETNRLDNLPFDREKYNMLYMDVQGCEDMVLKGAPDTLKYINIVYTEVNRAELYEGNVMVEQLNELLKDFEQVHVNWTGDTWGDAVYKRVKPAVWISEPIRFVIENKEQQSITVEVLNAINCAFSKEKLLMGKNVEVVSFEATGLSSYREFLRELLSGTDITVGATKLLIRDGNGVGIIPNENEKFTIGITQRDFLKKPFQENIELVGDRSSYASDKNYVINKYTSMILSIASGKIAYLDIYPASKKRS